MRHGHPFPTRSSLAWPAPSLAALAAGLWVLPQANPRTCECEPAVSSCLRFGAAEPGASIGRRPRRLIGAATAPPPPRCAIWPARVRHVVRRHAEIKQAMGFRRFIFPAVTKLRDEWDPPAPP